MHLSSNDLPDARVAATAIALLSAMAIAGVLGRRQRAAAVLLGLLSFAWLTVDRLYEGAVLITVSSTHGLVASDLVGLAGLTIAAWELWRLRG